MVDPDAATDPAKLVLADLASDMIASLILLNTRQTFRTLLRIREDPICLKRRKHQPRKDDEKLGLRTCLRLVVTLQVPNDYLCTSARIVRFFSASKAKGMRTST